MSKFTDYSQVIFHYKMNVLTVAAFVSFDNFSSNLLKVHLDIKGHLKDNIEIWYLLDGDEQFCKFVDTQYFLMKKVVGMT